MCSGCKEWYHRRCGKILAKVFSSSNNEHEKWRCHAFRYVRFYCGLLRLSFSCVNTSSICILLIHDKNCEFYMSRRISFPGKAEFIFFYIKRPEEGGSFQKTLRRRYHETEFRTRQKLATT